jgi:hypothetical protein
MACLQGRKTVCGVVGQRLRAQAEVGKTAEGGRAEQAAVGHGVRRHTSIPPAGTTSPRTANSSVRRERRTWCVVAARCGRRRRRLPGPHIDDVRVVSHDRSSRNDGAPASAVVPGRRGRVGPALPTNVAGSVAAPGPARSASAAGLPDTSNSSADIGPSTRRPAPARHCPSVATSSKPRSRRRAQKREGRAPDVVRRRRGRANRHRVGPSDRSGDVLGVAEDVDQRLDVGEEGRCSARTRHRAQPSRVLGHGQAGLPDRVSQIIRSKLPPARISAGSPARNPACIRS